MSFPCDLLLVALQGVCCSCYFHMILWCHLYRILVVSFLLDMLVVFLLDIFLAPYPLISITGHGVSVNVTGFVILQEDCYGTFYRRVLISKMMLTKNDSEVPGFWVPRVWCVHLPQFAVFCFHICNLFLEK